MDVFEELFSLCGEDQLFLEHGGGRFEAIGCEELEDFGEQIADLLRLFIKIDEPLVIEEEEVARFESNGAIRWLHETPFIERPEKRHLGSFAKELRF